MSATLPAIPLELRDESRAASVRVAIRHLFFRRRLWQFMARVVSGCACLLLLLIIIALIDSAWPLSRAWRVAMVAPVLLSALTGGGYAVWMVARQFKLSEMAREVERAAGRSENALVTFAESVEDQSQLSGQPYMLTRLENQARVDLERLDERVVAPRRGAWRGACLVVFILLILLALGLFAPRTFARQARRILWLERDEASSQTINANVVAASDESNAIAISDFRVRVVPPAYSGLSAEDVLGEAPVRALAGSQIEVRLTAQGAFESATLGFGGATHPMSALGEGLFSGSFIVLASGAFETRLIADDKTAPAPIVRAVEVYTDAPPEARITQPASDQLLRGVPNAPLPISFIARDDLGLADVALKYIRSRGEGDAAQFTNGTIPLGSVERGNAREWRGVAAIDLSRLGVQSGDTLVYWIEARDRTPSANNTGRSASLAVSILAPEPIKLNLGDLGPNEIGRFLLSQRMIIINTEKLHKERARLSREQLSKRSQEIAADQRDFKNSFNDYIKFEGAGGEPEHQSEGVDKTDAAEIEERVREADEERTGAHMHGIPEPPQGTPSNVRDMIYAIRAMWDAEEALSLSDTAKALTHEREALTRLKRAQLAVRYVPPIVARSKPIDLKRRYAGELNEIKTRLEKLSRRALSKESVSLRNALKEAYAALSDLQGTLDVPVTARASAIARAREKAREAADHLADTGGDHAATIAEATGQLRIVETELARFEMGGTADEYATRLSKPLALLTQAAGNLFAIAEASTRAGSGSETDTFLPVDDARAAEYFRLLNK